MVPSGKFPQTRLRRLRTDRFIRSLVRESHIITENLIYPVFVIEGNRKVEPVASMPGVSRLSIDELVKCAVQCQKVGIHAMAIFPVIDQSLKSSDGREALNEDGLVYKAIRALKRDAPGISVIADVALDPFTSHGQDGLLSDSGEILNDETVDVLAKQALLQAAAGCDIVAPSDMMDGRVGVIRNLLDEQGFKNVKIMSYAAKYASNFYGPFRDAVGSAQNLGGGQKYTYQMDPANSDEALREAAFDVEEGADMLLVKPGLPYLDIVYRVSQLFKGPTLAYQVSGEYSMLKLASQKGLIQERECVLEAITAMFRAGAKGVLTYYALQVANWLAESKGDA